MFDRVTELLYCYLFAKSNKHNQPKTHTHTYYSGVSLYNLAKNICITLQ